MVVKTERLLLVPFSREMAEAALRNRTELQPLFRAHVPDDWPGPDFEEILPLVVQWLKEDPLLCDWMRVAVHTADRTAIGVLGGGARPDAEGVVEIGYNIVPAYRRQGYGYEAVSAFVDWAFTQSELKRITSNCPDDNRGSMRILQKVGMRQWSYEGSLLHWEITKEQYLASRGN